MGSKHERAASAWRGSPQKNPAQGIGLICIRKNNREHQQTTRPQECVRKYIARWGAHIGGQTGSHRCGGDAEKGAPLQWHGQLAGNCSHEARGCFSYRNRTLGRQGHRVFVFFHVNLFMALGFGCAVRSPDLPLWQPMSGGDHPSS